MPLQRLELTPKSVNAVVVALRPFEKLLTGSKSQLGLVTRLQDLGMTSNELRETIADALDGASARLGSGIVEEAPSKREAKSASVADPLSDVTKHVLKAGDVARQLGVSTSSIYEAVKAGEMPALHFARRVLIPTHALRDWMRAGELERT